MQHNVGGHSTFVVSNIDFLSYGFKGLGEDEQFWVTGFPNDPLSVPPWQWSGYGAPPGLPVCIHSTHNNYIAVSSFKRGTDGKYHRRKANFSRMHIVMVDDVGTKVPLERLVLSPSVQVETSPGNFQAWYFLKVPEPDPRRAVRLIDGMIENGLTADASDPGMRGVTRYGRLPVGVNGKAKYVERIGHPFVQTVPIWSPHVRYSIEEIADAYEVDLNVFETHKRRQVAAPKHSVAKTINGDNTVLDLLIRADLYQDSLDGIAGAHVIICPWVHEHTDEDPSGTVYFEPSEENNWHGGFKCHHGHCQSRNIADLSHFMARLQLINQG